MTGDEPAAWTLGEKIGWLIGHKWPPDAAPPRTSDEVARAISAATGTAISGTAVWKLQTGRNENPTLKTLTILATFFAVPLGFFGHDDDAAQIGEAIGLLSLLRQRDITGSVLLTLADLSAGNRLLISEMIQTADRIEQQQTGNPEQPPCPRCGAHRGHIAARDRRRR
jgi:transcriptional regulator with XRE-family HTH domain